MSVSIWQNLRAVTMQPDSPQSFGLIDDAALVVDGATLAWVGPRNALPAEWTARATQRHDAGGALVTPGLIDCHTHLVYGGDRANEFSLDFAIKRAKADDGKGGGKKTDSAKPAEKKT